MCMYIKLYVYVDQLNAMTLGQKVLGGRNTDVSRIVGICHMGLMVHLGSQHLTHQ